MTAPYGHVDIAGYLFGLLDAVEFRMVEEHLASCAACRHEVTILREIEDALEEVPPELFMDGPDPAADLLLQRTLREARVEATPQRSWGRALVASAAAVVALAMAIGGGVAIGRSGEPKDLQVQPSPSESVPGTRTVSADDPTTGAHLTASLVPAEGWVKVNISVKGIKPGEKCRMVVIDRGGNEVLAGSWVISEKAAATPGGWPVSGTALVDPADVEAVAIETIDDDHLVTASF